MRQSLQETPHLVKFTEEILNGKPHFLDSDTLEFKPSYHSKWIIKTYKTYIQQNQC